MAFMIGTVKCQCWNVMGMPTDVGKCTVCEEKQTFFGNNTYSRLEEWAKEHSKKHDCN